MSINCGEINCKEEAEWQDRCGCVFCKKHKHFNHGGIHKIFDPFPKTKFFNARSNDYLEGIERGREQTLIEELEEIIYNLKRTGTYDEIRIIQTKYEMRLKELKEKSKCNCDDNVLVHTNTKSAGGQCNSD